MAHLTPVLHVVQMDLHVTSKIAHLAELLVAVMVQALVNYVLVPSILVEKVCLGEVHSFN